MEEEFRDIENYEGLYQISNLGRIKSLNYRKTGREQILRPGMTKDGYLFANLHKDGEDRNYYVHRLVAQAFISNPFSLQEINHIDEDKTNNRVDNLEWCSHQYNMNFHLYHFVLHY
mgnify:CR=1 FL=1